MCAEMYRGALIRTLEHKCVFNGQQDDGRPTAGRWSGQSYPPIFIGGGLCPSLTPNGGGKGQIKKEKVRAIANTFILCPARGL